MRKVVFIILLLFITKYTSASHVKGGWILYQLQSSDSAAKTKTYKITVTVYYGYGIGGPRNSITLDVYDAKTFSFNKEVTIASTTRDVISKTTFSPCMSNPPVNLLIYEVHTYGTNLTLPDNTNG
jgi:hypothetical protein